MHQIYDLNYTDNNQITINSNHTHSLPTFREKIKRNRLYLRFKPFTRINPHITSKIQIRENSSYKVLCIEHFLFSYFLHVHYLMDKST